MQLEFCTWWRAVMLMLATMAAQSTATTWAQFTSKHCGNHKLGGGYTTVGAAKSACLLNTQCNGVYSVGCSNSGTYYMCDKAYAWEASSSGSCVYSTEAPATCNLITTACSGSTPVNKGSGTVCSGNVASCNAATCCEAQTTIQAQTNSYTKRATSGACGIFKDGGQKFHERCHCVGKSASFCKGQCDIDVACVGYVQHSVSSGTNCQYATTSTCNGQCVKHNVGSVGEITRGPGNNYEGCYVKGGYQQGATTTPATTTTPQACSWRSQLGMYATGYAGGVRTKYTLSDAKSKCIELGKSVCEAVTCVAASCTVRASSISNGVSSIRTTHTPDATCFAASATTTPLVTGVVDQATDTTADDDPLATAKSWWPSESWQVLGFCQIVLLSWIIFDRVVRPRVLRRIRRQYGQGKVTQARQAYLLGSLLLGSGICFSTYSINKEHSPDYWYVPMLMTFVFAAVSFRLLRFFCPDNWARIFVLDVISEETDDGNPPAIESLPEYWTNKRHRNPVNFDQRIYVRGRITLFNNLLQSSYEPIATRDRPCPKGVSPCATTAGGCPCVRPGGDPGLPTAFVARRVIRNENSEIWQRYDAKRTFIKDLRAGDTIRPFDPPVKTSKLCSQNSDVFEPLDDEICEVYLWHGTSVRVALSIAQSDFRIDLAGSNMGTMYGQGAYLCESSTKCDEYARDDPGGYYEGIRALVLCRVVMGKYYYTTDRDQQAGAKTQAGEYDSTMGDRAKSVNTFREFVVYDNDQIYPEYVVLYSRAHGAEEEKKLAEAATVPFLMELPLYWANCHSNAAQDPFDHRYQVRDSCKDIIQQLANGTRTGGKSIQVLDVYRMEDSKMWTAYSNFKLELKSRGNSKDDADAMRASTSGTDVEKGNNKNRASCAKITDLDKGCDVSLTEKVLQNLNAEDSISLEQLDETVNEMLLWHGSSREAVNAIGEDGFIIPKGTKAKHGKRFGEGAYLAEDLDKSLQYTTPDGDGIVYFLLCRATLGEVHLVQERVQTDAHVKALEAGKHSILACPPGDAREFIVLEGHQVYPEFIVTMRV